jgi:MraZ protein
MFIGEHAHNLDNKGRVSVPAKYRGELSEGLVVTRGLDHCLWIYTKPEWEKIAGKLAALPISQKKSRAFSRLMLAGAWDAELDSQGRIVLPEYLRSYASLNKHVIIAGLYNRIEVWDEDSWQTYSQQTQEDSDEIAEGMSELGI